MSGIDWFTGGCLLFLSVCDIRKKEIPLWAVGILGGGLLVFRIWQKTGLLPLASGLLPGVVVLLLSVWSRGKIGFGDGLALCALGLGYTLETTLGILGLALVLAAVGAMMLLITKRAGRDREMPFLPYLTMGYVMCVMSV